MNDPLQFWNGITDSCNVSKYLSLTSPLSPLIPFCNFVALSALTSMTADPSHTSSVKETYFSLCQDPLSPLSHPSIPPIILSPQCDYNNIVLDTTRSNYMIRLFGQISKHSKISWDMNLNTGQSVCACLLKPNFFLMF